MRSSKILSLLTLVFAFCVMIQVIPVKAETYIADKEWSKLKPGDVIYFDNSEVEWDEVYIYIWGKKDDNTTTDTYKEWKNSDKMEKVEGEEKIYKFIVPDTMAVDTYNMIIFKNGNGDSVEQTIDLGFIEEGFAYKIEKNKTGDNNKKIGYWYLYDKSDITEHLDGAKKSQQDKQYYKNYNQKLDELITEIETKLESEIILYEEQEDGHGTGKYYIEIDTPIEEMKKIVDSLEVNDELLRDKIKEI